MDCTMRAGPRGVFSQRATRKPSAGIANAPNVFSSLPTYQTKSVSPGRRVVLGLGLLERAAEHRDQRRVRRRRSDGNRPVVAEARLQRRHDAVVVELLVHGAPAVMLPHHAAA